MRNDITMGWNATAMRKITNTIVKFRKRHGLHSLLKSRLRDIPALHPPPTRPPLPSVRWDPTYQYTRRCKVWRAEKAKICAEMKLTDRTHWPKNRRWLEQACGQFCRITAHQQLHQQAIHQRPGKWRESWELPCHKPGRTRMEVIEKQILKTFILAKNSQISCRNKLKNGTGTVSFPVLSIWIARGEAWPKEARGVMGEGKRNYVLIRYPAQTNIKHLSCNKQSQLGYVNTNRVRLSLLCLHQQNGWEWYNKQNENYEM